MGFGNTKMRKYVKQNGRWQDRLAPRHKHDYSVAIVVRVLFKMNVSRAMIYSAMKCRYCNSFHMVEYRGNITGFIPTERIFEFNALPVLTLNTEKNTIGTFAYCDFVNYKDR